MEGLAACKLPEGVAPGRLLMGGGDVTGHPSSTEESVVAWLDGDPEGALI